MWPSSTSQHWFTRTRQGSKGTKSSSWYPTKNEFIHILLIFQGIRIWWNHIFVQKNTCIQCPPNVHQTFHLCLHLMPLLSALKEWFIPSLMAFDNWIERGESIQNISQYLVSYWPLALAFSSPLSYRNRIRRFGCDAYLTSVPNRKEGSKDLVVFLQLRQE